MSALPAVRSRSPEETARLGARIGAALASGSASVVVALEGELGAGKTRFVRGLAAGLGADPDAVTSPSFVLAIEHPGAQGTLMHVDAWRLRSAAELESLGLEEWLASPGYVIAIEWASRVLEALPAERIDVQLEHVGPEERLIEITDRRGSLEAAALIARAMAPTVRRCPRCEGAVDPEATTLPFCSRRCRDADLARWFRGDYRISRPVEPDDVTIDDEPR